ncbi:hypothetical protein L195_g041513 [Trifolium pratense]|uniref:Uncharacterized protein n=1 Tax=Trifolium pratense TaxID=57577 RepID=A0A2K3M3V4_TRIPR|nr:hypothetical protein L195_g041513 [Trifolium pratense]
MKFFSWRNGLLETWCPKLKRHEENEDLDVISNPPSSGSEAFGEEYNY